MDGEETASAGGIYVVLLNQLKLGVDYEVEEVQAM
jgi:hypothetical protein